MSKVKSPVLDVVPSAPTTTAVPNAAPAMPSVASAAPPAPKLADMDKMALDLAKSRRQTVLAEAKTALANNEAAEANFKYLVLQIYMKYGLNSADAISEDGTILIGGAVQENQGK